MCGICGFVNLDHSTWDTKAAPPADEADLSRMISSLRHRGPDGDGRFVDGPVALGHARLSIIDLEGGWQPLFNEDRSIALVCNGEIYNFRELRSELEARGHSFRTGSDSEVIVHLWEEYGEQCVEHLRGMFAFALYDSRQRTLFAARDFFGQKPFYYAHTAGQFAFGSELKPLLQLKGLSRELDLVALDQFLFYQFVPHPRTMFKSIRQLPPAHTLKLKDGRLEIARYWVNSFAPDKAVSTQQQVEETEAALLDAVESHLVSDVPVGVFLSGGIDSSLMLAMASQYSGERLKTFSISFHGTKADEAEFAREASVEFGSEHHEFAFDATSIEDNLVTAAALFDQPLADSAALPLIHLSREASKHVKVVLTGDGGDELFGGYRKYRRAASFIGSSEILHRFGRTMFPASRLAASNADPLSLKRMQSRMALMLTPTQRCSYYRNYWEGWDRHSLYEDSVRDAIGDSFAAVGTLNGETHPLPMHAVNRMLQIDQAHYLPDDLLLKTDHATMAYGLEARAPMLDHRLAGVAGRLTPSMKVTSSETKVTLRRLADRWLPASLARRPKKGFSFPIRDWFQGSLHGWLRDSLLSGTSAVNDYFQREHVERVLDEHRDGVRNHGGRLYSLLMFELWHQNFVAQEQLVSEQPVVTRKSA